MEEDRRPEKVVVDRERKSYTGVIVGVIAVILLVLLLLFALPFLTGGNNMGTDVEVTPTPTAPAPTSPNTGE